MADQGKWFKLWCSSLRDDDLENLSIHEWFAWARFGTHMKENGKDGKIRLREPATAVVNLLRVPSFRDAVDMLKRFPNYEVLEASPVTPDRAVTVAVKCKNWNKYQGDWSRDRVRKHRLHVTANVTAQEEKRREEKKKRVFIPPTFDEVVSYAKTKSLPLNADKFFNHYEAKGWMSGKTRIKDWRASARLAASDWARTEQTKQAQLTI